MARSAWLRMTSAGFFAGSLVFLFLGGCFVDIAAQPGTCEDDNNPCTKDSCDANDKPSHVAVDDNAMVKCLLGENEGVCTGGICELTCKTQMTPCKCNSKIDCPTDNLCATWACTMGACVSTAMLEGMTADPLMPGDCQRKICQGGALKIADDLMDTPTDIKGDCQDPVCNGGVPGMMVNDSDVPAMDSMPGDCKAPACNGGVLGTMLDTADFPMAAECKTFACSAEGLVTEAKAPIGTKCGPNNDMACDRDGVCAACLPAGKDDYDKCKMNSPGMMCPVPKCEGQPCADKTECSKECTDGVCCDKTCTEECKSCTVAGKVGTCTDIAYYQPDSYYELPDGSPRKCEPMTNGAVCDGKGKCLKTVLTTCTLGTQCISGVCQSIMMTLKCKGATGEACFDASECVSNMCNAGTCK